MTRDEIRLELLRLTYAHGREVAEAVSRAKELEKYLFEDNTPQADSPFETVPRLKSPVKPQKK